LEAANHWRAGKRAATLWRQASWPASQRGFQPRDPLAMARGSKGAPISDPALRILSQRLPYGALSNVHPPMPIWKSALRKLGNKKAPDCSGALMKTN